MMKKNSVVTAIFMIAVIFIGNSLSGCVTSRHIDELKAEHRGLKQQVDDTQAKVAKMEAVILEGADASKMLRNDVSLSTEQMQEQMYTLLENYNELLRIMQEINAQVHSTKVLTGSVRGDMVVKQPTTQTSPPVIKPEQPAVDCGNNYDEAFILVRGEEYDNAIGGFEIFLAKCPTHASVENAHYWIGECYYSQDKFIDAIAKFEFLLKNFKSTVNASRAMYKLGRCKQELGKDIEAKEIYTKLIDDHPETLEASQAKERLKDIK